MKTSTFLFLIATLKLVASAPVQVDVNLNANTKEPSMGPALKTNLHKFQEAHTFSDAHISNPCCNPAMAKDIPSCKDVRCNSSGEIRGRSKTKRAGGLSLTLKSVVGVNAGTVDSGETDEDNISFQNYLPLSVDLRLGPKA
ncbi:hypothetical protein TWF481_011876 [Arthrobotrys musiformis]|uniref:Uncharacterized protein n=1 Tax=Arthrobotrys musiformis TaxID=47236 RepID=A0AAV9VXH3_9PEZI